MINRVLKRDGTYEPFTPDKLNKWAEYATDVGGNWSLISLQTVQGLPDGCSTADIHQRMIDVCVMQRDLTYSRVASRLEVASIRKSMSRLLGVDDRSRFKDIRQAYLNAGIWDVHTIPAFDPRWDDWYVSLSVTPFEHWQVKQWVDKYSIKHEGEAIETPVLGFIGIAMSIFNDDAESAYHFARALVLGKINLPTPVLNGCRNGDFDTISCCVISGDDETDSLGVADYIAYRMTAKKAGIGIQLTTRSIGDSVKRGRVRHLGKGPLYRKVEKSVKALTQVTRGGNATVTVLSLDPEIEDIMMMKSQKTDIKRRLDMLDYSFGYNDAFAVAVIKNEPWALFSYADAPELYKNFGLYTIEQYNTEVERLKAAGKPHTLVNARQLLKTYLTIRYETGRFYDINLSRANLHTPFIDVIVQSNLCMEIALPTRGYSSMYDLVATARSHGETAFCSLSALNVMKIEDDEYEFIAYIALRAVDRLIDRVNMMWPSMTESVRRRRSVGIGVIGFAGALYNAGLDFDGSKRSLVYTQYMAERHYYYLLKASQAMAAIDGYCVPDVDLNWLPIDTAMNKHSGAFAWEMLRGKPRKHSVLVAHMPTESSSAMSSAPNGLYPVREKIVSKRSRKGWLQYICESFVEGKNLTAWEVDNFILARYYGLWQDSTDQAISADAYFTPRRYPGGKVKMSELMRLWLTYWKYGVKTKYYVNTEDDNGGGLTQDESCTTEQPTVPSFIEDDVEDEGCESCKL